MGGWSSRARDEADVDEAVTRLPSPLYCDDFWMVSCRNVGCMNVLSQRTLLFQPDCRLFCQKGLKCKQLTNEVHRQLYIHTTKAAVLKSAATDVASRGRPATLVVNLPEDLDVAVPFVSRCWAIEASGANVEVTASLPDGLQNRPVIIWVHGFRQRYFRITSVVSHLLANLRDRVTTASEASRVVEAFPAVLAFTWPCHLKAIAYARSRAHAEEAAARLATLLRLLRSRGCRIVLAGHSLGSRVALRALLQETGAEDRGVDNMCSHLLLLSAAVPSDALSSTGEFPRHRIAASKIVVVSSPVDDVLSTYFKLGEGYCNLKSAKLAAPMALGLVGPVSPFPVALDHVVVAHSSACHIPPHSPNALLRSPVVLECIATAAGLCSVPDGNALSASAWPNDTDIDSEDDDAVSLESQDASWGTAVPPPSLASC